MHSTAGDDPDRQVASVGYRGSDKDLPTLLIPRTDNPQFRTAAFVTAERHQIIQTIKAITTTTISAGRANLKSVFDGKLAVTSAATTHTCRK